MKISKDRIQGIQRELAEMAQVDEDIMMGKVDLHDDAIDRNSERLEKIIDEIGWPTRSLLGNVAAAQAWSIATRNPRPETHRRYLEMMRASEEMMMEKSYIAHFEDQTRVCCGQPELYGTGFRMNDEGQYEPFPIESMDRLDERRASMNLGSYNEFLARIEGLNGASKSV